MTDQPMPLVEPSDAPPVTTLSHQTPHTRQDSQQPSNLQEPSPQRFQFKWLNTIEELENIIPQWSGLCSQAAWKNISFEPHFLIPAMQHLASDQVRVLIVEDQSAVDTEEKLVGLVPFEKKRIFHLPISTLEVWNHEQCFDATPLLRNSCKNVVWRSICEFLKKEGIGLLSLDTVSAEAEFNEVLDAENNGHLAVFKKNEFERAAFQPANSAEEYIKTQVSTKANKKFRRLFRRFDEQGELTVERSQTDCDFAALAEEFLSLEASGWKGQNQSALACHSETREFYRALVARSAAAGMARFLTMRLDGKPVAMLSDLRSDNIVYSYKTAFDESYSEFSPGIQIELKNIEFLHTDGIELADSCTASDNAAINRIWGQRLKFQTLVVALKPGIPKFVTSVLPRMQSIYRRFKRKNN